MSDDDSPRPVDRPKLAEALASLKQGLGDSADPFFDGWKRPRPEAQALDNVAKVAELRPAAAETIEQTAMVDTLPTEIGGVFLSDDRASLAAQVPPHDEQHAPTIDLEKVRLALSPEETSASARLPEETSSTVLPQPVPGPQPSTVFTPKRQVASAKASVRDTVRVRVVRYPVFPRWALVVAAALVVFAASLLALRAGYPRQAPALVLATSGAPPGEVSAREPTAVAVEEPPAPPAAVPSPILVPNPSAVPERGQDRPARELRNNKSRDTRPHAPDLFREPGF